MYEYEMNIFINRSPQDVFNFVSNPNNFVQWQNRVEFGEWTTNGSPGVGSTFRNINSFLGRKIEAKHKITGWNPPIQYSFKSIGSIQGGITRKFQPQADGTLLIETGQLEIGGIFKLLEGLLGKQIEKSHKTSLPALKLVLESD